MSVQVTMDFRRLRHEMVERAIFGRGVRSELVLDAMRKVPREAFLPGSCVSLPTRTLRCRSKRSQTISQPYIVAFMTEALGAARRRAGAGDRGRIGLRGGGPLADRRRGLHGRAHRALAEKAAARLADLGYDNVHVLHGDGTKGWPEHAPYDGIIVAAGGPKIPNR